MKVISQNEALDRLDKIVGRSGGEDTELDHAEADDLLCEVLDSLGYAELVSRFRAMEKWYA